MQSTWSEMWSRSKVSTFGIGTSVPRQHRSCRTANGVGSDSHAVRLADVRSRRCAGGFTPPERGRVEAGGLEVYEEGPAGRSETSPASAAGALGLGLNKILAVIGVACLVHPSAAEAVR